MAVGRLARVAGIGFTVYQHLVELTFDLGNPHDEHAKVGIRTGSAIVAVVGRTVLAVRNTRYEEPSLAGKAVDEHSV